jgi:pimeloyl-ACP methyl ester carboxylesterase
MGISFMSSRPSRLRQCPPDGLRAGDAVDAAAALQQVAGVDLNYLAPREGAMHDLAGAAVHWIVEAGHPGRVAGVIGVNTPFRARSARDPVELLREHVGDRHYIVWFQTPGEAERLFDADPARVIRRFQRRRMTGTHEPNGAFDIRRQLAQPEESWTGEPLLAADEVEVYRATFAHSGFRGGVNWYRNISRNWRTTSGATDRIEVPSLMIVAADDPFIPPRFAEGMEKLIPDLEKQVIADCGHWTQAEQPEALNRIMLDWLRRRYPAKTAA